MKMLRSKFMADVGKGKQEGDTLAVLTVPINAPMPKTNKGNTERTPANGNINIGGL
jgi:hypothetical protein